MELIDAATLTVFLSALGLSGASGLNPWLPLLVTGILVRVDWLQLSSPWEQFGGSVALVVLALLFVVDFIGDKRPGLDRRLQAAGFAVAPLAGALIFDAQAGGQLPALVCLLVGAATAGVLHTARAGVRPAVSRGGRGGRAGGGKIPAPVVSGLEDLAALLLVISAFALPVVAGLAVLALLWAGLLAIHRLAQLLSRRRAVTATVGSPLSEPPKLR